MTFLGCVCTIHNFFGETDRAKSTSVNAAVAQMTSLGKTAKAAFGARARDEVALDVVLR